MPKRAHFEQMGAKVGTWVVARTIREKAQNKLNDPGTRGILPGGFKQKITKINRKFTKKAILNMQFGRIEIRLRAISQLAQKRYYCDHRYNITASQMTTEAF